MVPAKKSDAVPSSIVPTKLYSTAVLAAYLSIHPRTLESWRRLGTHPELKWTRVGRRIRYSGQAILDFLDDGTSPQPKRRGVR
jgi:hypothetical protein